MEDADVSVKSFPSLTYFFKLGFGLQQFALSPEIFWVNSIVVANFSYVRHRHAVAVVAGYFDRTIDGIGVHVYDSKLAEDFSHPVPMIIKICQLDKDSVSVEDESFFLLWWVAVMIAIR